MRYRLVIFIFFGVFVSTIFSQQFIETENLSEEGYKVYFYEVFDDGKDSHKKLLVYFGNKNNEKYLVYDYNGQKTYEKEIGKHITRRKNYFRHDDKIYILEKKLYSIDLTNLTFDSTDYNFSSDDYSYLQIFENEPDDILIANTQSNVDVYNFKTFEKISNVKRDSPLKYAAPSEHTSGIIIIKNRDNELAAFDINTSEQIWLLNSGTIDASFLGISVGSFENYFSNYLINKSKNKLYLYASTGFGYLYKIELKTGKIILHKENFKGSSDNDGSLTSLYVEDMNRDGIYDLVGAAVDENIYCINGKDFSLLWEYDTGNEHQMPLALYDINGDKIKDVFGVNDYDNILSVVDGSTGDLIEEIDIKDTNKFFQTYPVVEDFYEKGFVNMMLRTRTENLRLYKIKLQ